MNRLLPVATALLSAALGTAQAPSPWSDLSLAGGPTPTSIGANGMLVTCRAGNALHVFSAATARWHTLSISFGTTPQATKELALVPESDRWIAFSAWRGVAETLLVPTAQTTMAATDSLACVTDGNTLHTFSAFTGQWHSRAIPTGWILETGPRIALLRTPALAPSVAASAFDAFTGQWHDLPPQPLSAYSVRLAGCSAVVATQQQQFGFSALRPGWVQSPVTAAFPFPTVNTSYQAGDLVAGLGSIFSGLTGTFADSPFPASAGSFTIAGNVASGSDGTQHVALGASSNTWVPLTSQPWSPYLDANCVLGYGNGARTAFSPLHDSTATHAGQNGLIRGNVAAVDAATFSTLTGQWYDAPATAAALANTGRNSATWSTPAGLVGWSAYDGSLTTQPGAIVPTTHGFAGHDASAVYAFDALGRRWLSQARTAGSVYAADDNNLVLVAAPGQAIGYSTRGRRLVPQTLAEPWSAVVASELAGCVVTATHVYAFSGLGETMTWQGDPEDLHAAGRGTTVRLQARVPAGHFVAMAFGPYAATPVATPFGDAWLDPTAAVVLPMPAAPGESRAVLPVAIPTAPALRNSLWLQQAITLAPNGSLWLGAPSVLHVQ